MFQLQHGITDHSDNIYCCFQILRVMCATPFFRHFLQSENDCDLLDDKAFQNVIDQLLKNRIRFEGNKLFSSGVDLFVEIRQKRNGKVASPESIYSP